MNVPSGMSQFVVNMTGTGDADLYVKYGSAPTTSSYDCRPYNGDANERCALNSPSAGDWFIMVRGYSTSSSYSLTASYSGGGGASAPSIYDINPKSVSVGEEKPFTVSGIGFQSGIRGTLWVGSNSFPIDSSRTLYLSPTQVLLTVRVGASNDPTTPFSLQVTNLDGQASNKYSGLTAVAGGGGSAGTPNIQISFSPNPVTRGSDGKWAYSVTLRETNGVAVNLTGLSIGGTDYSQNIASWFGTNQLAANGQITGGFTSTGSAGTLTWTFSGSGLTWSQSVTLQ
jgi:hypothetical protein